MSHTDKDRPYWVKLNDEGIVVHDHTFCSYGGRRSYTRFGAIIRDDEGNPVMETVEDKRTAQWIADNAPRTKDYYVRVNWPTQMAESMRYTLRDGQGYWLTTGKGVNPIWQEAQKLVTLGRGDREMVYKTSQRVKREEVIMEIPQECTEDRLEGPRFNNRYNHNGCYRTLPAEHARYRCSCSMCEPGGIYAEKKSRTRRKNTLRNMAKAYDGEAGWEDEFEEKELSLSRPLRYTSQWC